MKQELNGVVAVPIEKLSATLEENKSLTANERLCYIFMVYFMQQTGKIPNQEELGKHIGVSRQSVSAYIQKLVELDIISETRYSDYERTTENPKGNYIDYDLKIQSIGEYEGTTPNNVYQKKTYKCFYCGEQVQNIVNHFRLAHKEPDIKNIIANRMNEISGLIEEELIKGTISYKFFRKASMVMPEHCFTDAKKEFQEAITANGTKIRNKGGLMNKIIRDMCKIHHVTI